MKTKSPIFDVDKNYNLRIGFRTGAFDLVNPSIRWEQKVNDNLSSTLNVEYLHSTGKYKYRYNVKIILERVMIPQLLDVMVTSKHGA